MDHLFTIPCIKSLLRGVKAGSNSFLRIPLQILVRIFLVLEFDNIVINPLLDGRDFV